MESNQNNLTFVRLVAALMVLYDHAFVFLGSPKPLFLGYYPLGPLGVFIFFSISGYLVAQSWDRDPDFWRFLLRRVLRIFPGLSICIILSVSVLGPLLTDLSLTEYFSHPATFGYLSNIFLYVTYYLPGVFESNRVANAVNGSLWSLPAEFAMYILLCTLGLLKFKKIHYWILFVIFAYLSIRWLPHAKEQLVFYRTDLREVVSSGVYFWIGCVFYVSNLKKYFSLSNALIVFVLLLCTTRWPTLFQVYGFFAIPFLVLSFGLSSHHYLVKLTRFDFSYGVYIYAFPVQQTLVKLWPDMSLVSHLLIASAASTILAAFSWYFIEKPSLKFKPKH